MQTALVLTLGHGSSAIYISKGKIQCGYQTERLTGTKGDSRFPSLAIERIQQECKMGKLDAIYISHWEPTGIIDNMADKHWNRSFLEQQFPNVEIITVSSIFSHHDAHAYSALAYNFDDHGHESYVLVADGFGTMGEVLSIYRLDKVGIMPIQRCYGYINSLGLLYQYATDYVGFKMNQDEYKLNAMANQLSSLATPSILDHAKEVSDRYVKGLKDSKRGGPDDPIISIGALSHVHKEIHVELEQHYGPDQKAEIAFFLQNVVQFTLMDLIEEFIPQPRHLTLVGGCFLNVQLNGFLSNLCKSISVMPLSGDEGAGLGLYTRYNHEFEIPDDLCWGRRNLNPTIAQDCVDSLLYVPKNHFAREVGKWLKQGYVVNAVRGAMEFGPRAYCNTSTLALPTITNREYINKVNNRHEAMPMCPVMTIDQYDSMVHAPCSIIRSSEHMIMALQVRDDYIHDIEGTTFTQLDGLTTCRPQVIYDDHYLYDVVGELGPLINTSFNNHGQPICLDLKQVLSCHDYMKHRDTKDRVLTIVELSE